MKFQHPTTKFPTTPPLLTGPALSRSVSVVMNSSKFEGSQKLINLAEQLQHYKPGHPPNNSNNSNPSRESRVSDNGNQVVSRELESTTSEQVKDQIANQSERGKPNKAAVLICLFEGEEGDIRVILTKRSSTLSSHSGEVALPGGKVEEGDANDVDTALREAKEEIGLDPSLVNVVTVLEPFMTKRDILVVPVIGIMLDKGSFNPVPNAAEVEAIFDAPLEMFLKDENRREVELEWMGDNYLLHFFDHEAENEKFVIWALTAGILMRAASIVYQRPPAFQERRPCFWNRSGL